jgi:hypothetical protein
MGSEFTMQGEVSGRKGDRGGAINTHDVITIDDAVISSIDRDHTPFGNSINSNDLSLNQSKITKNAEWYEIKEETSEHDQESSMNMILSRMLKDRKKNATDKGKLKIKKKNIKINDTLDASDNSSIRSPFGSKARFDSNLGSKGNYIMPTLINHFFYRCQ